MPRLRDLLTEYEVAGGNKVRVEIVDPLQNPKLEAEANQQYGIRPVPFQTSSKYQASVTNSYFDILVKYGDEHATLSYRELIEIKQRQGSEPNVELRDPEYELTRAIKKVLNTYRGGGNVLSGIPGAVELIAYISADAKLPEPMPELKSQLEALIGEYEAQAPENFDAKLTDPDAEGGAAFQALQQTYGLRPLAVGLLDQKQFWFHVFLRNGERVEQVPLPDSLDKDGLKRNIDAALKRFTPGALRTVALTTPPPNPMAQFGGQQSAGPSFRLLEEKLRENAAVVAEDLADGAVPEEADILFVAAPDALDEKQLFAIDQFLMKGGTVVLAASPFKASFANSLSISPAPTGLEDWLASHGVTLDKAMVLDPQNTPFPIPVERNVGGLRLQQVQLIDYPYFVDVRQDGLTQQNAPTVALDQLTLSWAAPIKIDEEKAKGRTVTPLIESSPASWTSEALNAVPDFRAYPQLGFEAGKETARQLIGVMMEGEFKSFFAGKPSPLAKDAKPEDGKSEDAGAPNQSVPGQQDTEKEKPSVTTVIERSPGSARIILLGSSTFLSDDILSLTSSVNQTQYLAPLNFAQNVVEWSLEDRGLLALRNRGGQFSRTLEPMAAGSQTLWEYLNYGLVLLGLGIVYLVRRALREAAKRRYRTMLGLEGA